MWKRLLKRVGPRQMVLFGIILVAIVNPWILYHVWKWDQKRRAGQLIELAMQGKGVLTFDWFHPPHRATRKNVLTCVVLRQGEKRRTSSILCGMRWKGARGR